MPHIAAGINLNIPVVGRLLRKGGAFFIRRSFAGNALYTVVFMKYLAAIMARGHSLEYFIEGGRSRTGRLLHPKTGMLSMTVRSFLRDPVRPVVFVPVYFGYERIVEANTYISELSGAPKKKESWWDLLTSFRVLARAVRHRARERRRTHPAQRHAGRGAAQLARAAFRRRHAPAGGERAGRATWRSPSCAGSTRPPR